MKEKISQEGLLAIDITLIIIITLKEKVSQEGLLAIDFTIF